jgi:hypothetical protein
MYQRIYTVWGLASISRDPTRHLIDQLCHVPNVMDSALLVSHGDWLGPQCLSLL